MVSAENGVLSAKTPQTVIAIASEYQIITCVADDCVVAAETFDGVVEGTPNERIVICSAFEMTNTCACSFARFNITEIIPSPALNKVDVSIVQYVVSIASVEFIRTINRTN